MEQWPGNPVASMVVSAFPYQAIITPGSAKVKQNVIGGAVQFVIDLQFNINGPGYRGNFIGELFKITDAGSNTVDLQNKLLGGAPAGTA